MPAFDTYLRTILPGAELAASVEHAITTRAGERSGPR